MGGTTYVPIYCVRLKDFLCSQWMNKIQSLILCKITIFAYHTTNTISMAFQFEMQVEGERS